MVYRSRKLFASIQRCFRRPVPYACVATPYLYKQLEDTHEFVKSKNDFLAVNDSGFDFNFPDLSNSSYSGSNEMSKGVFQQFQDSINGIITKINDIDQSVEQISKVTSDFWTFFSQLTDRIYDYSMTLLNFIFQILSTALLKLPSFLFNSAILKDSTLIFFSISLLLLMLLSMVNAIKGILRKPNTPFIKVLQRMPLALFGSAVAPYAFSKAFSFLNHLTDIIIRIGTSHIDAGKMILGANTTNLIPVITLVGFDLLVIYLLLPLLLKGGRRWFDLILLVMSTPLVLTAWIFDNTRHIFTKWLSVIKELSLIQLIYAIFITFMALVLFATATFMGPEAIIIKMLFVIGGLWRLSNPPQFIKSYEDRGADVLQIKQDYFNLFKKSKDFTNIFAKFKRKK
ncbi:hypothetical protein [Bacillus cereus]|nr:hypothetical protein [Bacillus cereus]